MDPATMLALALDPAQIFVRRGMKPDTWQREFLLCPHHQMMLCCSRGACKSRTTSALALHTALFKPGSLVLLHSRSQRQAKELLRYVMDCYGACDRCISTIKETERQLELRNRSRIVSLPGNEETIRSSQGANLLVLNEAVRIPDELYRSVRPMLGASKGRMVSLWTPFGKRGFFFNEWEDGGDAWHRIKVTWPDCPCGHSVKQRR